MSDLTNIMKKELKEYLSISSVISVVMVIVIFAFMGSMMTGEVDKMASPSHMLIVDCDTTDTTGYTIDKIRDVYDASYGSGTFDQYVTVIESQTDVDSTYVHDRLVELGYTDGIVICDNFYSNIFVQPEVIKGQVRLYFEYQSSGIFGGASSTISQSLMSVVNNQIAKELAEGSPRGENMISPIDLGSTYTFINGKFVENVTPMMINSALMSQNFVMPLIIMIILTMIGSIVISSMGNEKENKTLETLLTMPVKRMTIVTGKLISAAIAGLVFGVAYLIGMMFYMNGMNATMTSTLNLEDVGLTLGMTDWAIVMVMMFLAILSALGMCMILGAFTKNYKAAQTMILPLVLMSMVPMILIMFMGWENLPILGKVLLSLIPFTHPMMVINNLMFDNMTLVLAGIGYLLAFAALMVFITVRLYKSDILITGIGQTKFVVTMKKLFAKKSA